MIHITLSFNLIAYLHWHSCGIQNVPFSHMVDDRIYWLVLRRGILGHSFHLWLNVWAWVGAKISNMLSSSRLVSISETVWQKQMRQREWGRLQGGGWGVGEAIVASTDNPMQHPEQSSNTTIMSWPFSCTCWYIWQLKQLNFTNLSPCLLAPYFYA